MRRRELQISSGVHDSVGVPSDRNGNLESLGDGCCCAPVRPGAYATEINIYNHDSEWAYLQKSLIPVVNAGQPLGREPRTVPAQGWDWLAPPPGHATMDDCCRIRHLLFDATCRPGDQLVGLGVEDQDGRGVDVEDRAKAGEQLTQHLVDVELRQCGVDQRVQRLESRVGWHVHHEVPVTGTMYPHFLR